MRSPYLYVWTHLLSRTFSPLSCLFLSPHFLFLFNCSACFQQAPESNRWLNLCIFSLRPIIGCGANDSIVSQTLFNEQQESAGKDYFPGFEWVFAAEGLQKKRRGDVGMKEIQWQFFSQMSLLLLCNIYNISCHSFHQLMEERFSKSL